MPEFEIQLRDVMLFANHGILPEESITGNQYRVNVRLRLDAAFFDDEKDDLHSTLSYADVYDVLRSVMTERVHLLETITVKFARNVYERWPGIKGGWIEIVKTVPPIPNMIGEAGVRYDF